MGKADLIEFIGKNDYLVNDSSITANLTQYTGVFKIANDKVKEIEITRECDQK